jgi:hypothetical protein
MNVYVCMRACSSTMENRMWILLHAGYRLPSVFRRKTQAAAAAAEEEEEEEEKEEEEEGGGGGEEE